MSHKTIAAMTLALEALDAGVSIKPHSVLHDRLRVALREALAEQRLTDMQQKMGRSIESLKAALVQEQAASNTKTEPTHA